MRLSAATRGEPGTTTLAESVVEFPVSVTLGEAGTTTLAEHVTALPKERYRVEKYLVADITFVKFLLFDTDIDNPKAYFINTETHVVHYSFVNTVGLDVGQIEIFTGQITYHARLYEARRQYAATQGQLGFSHTKQRAIGSPERVTAL